MDFKKITDILCNTEEYGIIEDSIAIAHLKSNPETAIDKNPSHKPDKIDGMALILVREGAIDLEINMERYHVESNSFVVVPPSAVFNMRSVRSEQGDAYLLFMKREFLPEININYAAMSMSLNMERPSPVNFFKPDQIAQLSRMFEVLLQSTRFKVNTRLDRNVASCLISAIIYMVAQFFIKALEHDKNPQHEHARPSSYVQEFMHLLQIHYTKERSVAFYASKLFISPKYLSLLVKKATGRSASRWIDDRVILEARNLLRFSGKNVQQVAYMLNFTNQSSFGKYFKHLTGMSPTEYQKS